MMTYQCSATDSNGAACYFGTTDGTTLREHYVAFHGWPSTTMRSQPVCWPELTLTEWRRLIFVRWSTHEGCYTQFMEQVTNGRVQPRS